MPGGIDLGNIDVDVSGSLAVGLQDIRINQVPPISVNAGLDNLRVTELAPITVNAGLNDVRVREVAPLTATVDVGLDDVRIREIAPVTTTSTIDAGLDDIRLTELAPIRVELGVRPVRVHLPLSFSFCIELFGVRLLKLGLCGEGMVVAEDYAPRASERCEG